jgi:hypothetical protein
MPNIKHPNDHTPDDWGSNVMRYKTDLPVHIHHLLYLMDKYRGAWFIGVESYTHKNSSFIVTHSKRHRVTDEVSEDYDTSCILDLSMGNHLRFLLNVKKGWGANEMYKLLASLPKKLWLISVDTSNLWE